MIKILKNEYFLKTVIFILGVIVFVSYWNILGTVNAFVGVAIVQGALILLNKDLTANPVKNTIIFSLAFLYIGIFSYLAALNMYLGFFINFFALFFLVYNFVSDLTISIWVPFVLGYLYLLVKPVSQYYELKERLIALALGSLFIIISQLILNKNKSKEKIKENFVLLLDGIINKISNLNSGQKLNDKGIKVTEYLDNITSAIYNRRTSFFYIDDKDSILLNLSVCLERLNLSIKNVRVSRNKEETIFLNDLSNLVNDVKVFVENDNYVSILISDIDEFLNKYNRGLNNNYSIYDIIQNIEMLKFSLTNLINCTKKKKFSLKSIFNSFNKFKFKNLLRYNYKKSIKFTYAFKLSFLLAISYFIVEFFNIPEGKWITFTIFTVLQPYKEDSEKRFTNRFKGTIIGIVIFSLIDIFISSFYLKVVIYALCYYIYSIKEDFTLRTICMTTVGIGIFSMITDKPINGDIYRFIFVVIGIFIGYLGSRYVFPYSLKDSLDTLSSDYYKISLNIIYKGVKEHTNFNFINYIDEQLLLSKLFESKIIVNNSAYKLKNVNEFIYNQRFLNNDIYFLYFFMYKNNINSDIFSDFRKVLNSSWNLDKEDKSLKVEKIIKLKNDIKSYFDVIKDKENKLILITVYRILYRLEKSDKLIEEINNTLIK